MLTGLLGALFFMLPWVLFGIFTGIVPAPANVWLRVPYWTCGTAWVILGVAWDIALIVAALQ